MTLSSVSMSFGKSCTCCVSTPAGLTSVVDCSKRLWLLPHSSPWVVGLPRLYICIPFSFHKWNMLTPLYHGVNYRSQLLVVFNCKTCTEWQLNSGAGQQRRCNNRESNRRSIFLTALPKNMDMSLWYRMLTIELIILQKYSLESLL